MKYCIVFFVAGLIALSVFVNAEKAPEKKPEAKPQEGPIDTEPETPMVEGPEFDFEDRSGSVERDGADKGKPKWCYNCSKCRKKKCCKDNKCTDCKHHKCCEEFICKRDHRSEVMPPSQTQNECKRFEKLMELPTGNMCIPDEESCRNDPSFKKGTCTKSPCEDFLKTCKQARHCIREPCEPCARPYLFDEHWKNVC